jgi:TonB family protein
VQTSNNGSLDAAAIKAVRQWRFMVTAKQSPKRPVEVIVPIRFRIEMP